ncbi:hypothetical protein MA16_Dca022493 [Dendrobium catenatum]|uniref:Uncharacterized protein n=1 Tax=Dendrobium catenatum TaxID=906689 RepID=A0A2I0XFZ5_9ASPA|nr:hypothetical protein MA16_Dca022493 [Dendrobium catenatum]
MSANTNVADPVALRLDVTRNLLILILSPHFSFTGDGTFWTLESMTIDLKRTLFRLFGVVDLLFPVFVGTRTIFFLMKISTAPRHISRLGENWRAGPSHHATRACMVGVLRHRSRSNFHPTTLQERVWGLQQYPYENTSSSPNHATRACIGLTHLAVCFASGSLLPCYKSAYRWFSGPPQTPRMGFGTSYLCVAVVGTDVEVEDCPQHATRACIGLTRLVVHVAPYSLPPCYKSAYRWSTGASCASRAGLKLEFIPWRLRRWRLVDRVRRAHVVASNQNVVTSDPIGRGGVEQLRRRRSRIAKTEPEKLRAPVVDPD